MVLHIQRRQCEKVMVAGEWSDGEMGTRESPSNMKFLTRAFY